jgi:hypothetical protein
MHLLRRSFAAVLLAVTFLAAARQPANRVNASYATREMPWMKR